MQAVIDERADARQRQALATVLHGGETEEAKTHWWVFHAMSSTVHEPVYAPIEFEVDIERRRARVAIPGLLDATGRPIVSPATGDEHRVRIDIPNGIEFELAEIGSASTKPPARSSWTSTTPTASSTSCATRAPASSTHAPEASTPGGPARDLASTQRQARPAPDGCRANRAGRHRREPASTNRSAQGVPGADAVNRGASARRSR
jgi:hypothetical protein